ncbi:MAG: response regulator transcription factor [Flavobacteriales bacterium]
MKTSIRTVLKESITKKPTAIPVAIAHHCEAMRLGLTQMVEQVPGYKVVLRVGDGAELMAALRAGTAPRIALVDLHMKGVDGYLVLAWLHDHCPDVLPLALGDVLDDAATERAMNLCACGMVLHDVQGTELADALPNVNNGRFHRNAVVDRLLTGKRYRQPADLRRGPAPDLPLTKRELEFVRWWCHPEALPERIVAKHLGIAINTLHTTRKRVYRKLHVCNRAQAIRWALKQRVVFL